MQHIDLEISKILTKALQAAEDLKQELAIIELEGGVHSPNADFEIVFRYDDGNEWFAVLQWSGDWFEIVSGEEREKQINQRTTKDG